VGPPTEPDRAEGDPEHSIESRQDWSTAFAPKGGELDPEFGVLDRNGLVTAHQKSGDRK
jgi:hypothetical protein